MAAVAAMISFVELHTAVWSPLMRQLCAMGFPQVQGLSTPHSHMLNAMGRPVAFIAALMFP